MEAERLEEIKNFAESMIEATFRFFVGIVNILITLCLFLGAGASLILLSKMYPDIFLTVLDGVSPIFIMLLYIVKATIVVLCLSLCVYLIMYIFRKAQNVQDIERKKFMNDLVKKLKREINKK